MKRILVTGGAGSVGRNVVKFLLSEGKYEITVLDLNNKKSKNNLKKYRKRVNILYGDIQDKELMGSLVKTHDVIIHLASVMVPLADYSYNLGKLVEYDGTKNIINSIKKNNPKCHLLYASTTSLYDNSLNASVDEKIDESSLTYFSLNKYKTENLIIKELDNYTIFRLPLVLNNITNESFVFNVKKNNVIEVTTNYDAASCFVKSIEYLKKLNKKIFNVGMGKNGTLKYNTILNNILKYNGISNRFVLSRLFLEKNYYSPVTIDSDNLENIIHYRIDSLNKYNMRLKENSKKRKIQILIGKFILLFRRKD